VAGPGLGAIADQLQQFLARVSQGPDLESQARWSDCKVSSSYDEEI
jgi:hypothetical protein